MKPGLVQIGIDTVQTVGIDGKSMHLLGKNGNQLPETVVDSNNNPIGLDMGNGVTVPFNGTSCEAFGAKPSNTAAQNVTAIQNALNVGGLVTLLTPGTYSVAGTQVNSGTNELSDYGTISIPSDTELRIGKGVILQGANGATVKAKPIFVNSNANSNSVSVSNNTSATGTYTWAANVLTVVMANTFQAGQLVALAFTSGGAVDGKFTVLAGGLSAAGFTCTYTGAGTAGNVSLIAYTGVSGSPTDNAQYFNTKFNTAIAHRLTVGSYVLFKGDTSPYNWNKVWKVVLTPTPTSFVVQSYYTGCPLIVVGAVICYAANDNIKITVDGYQDMQMNNNQQANPFLLLSVAGNYFNKVGNLTIQGNFVNCVCIATVCNVDNFMSDYTGQRICSNGYQIIGPVKRAYLNNLTTEHSEEVVFLGTSDPSGVGITLRDKDNTINSGGNIGSLIVDGWDASHHSARAIAIGVDSGYTIERVIINNVDYHAAACPLVTIGQVAGTTGKMGLVSFTNVRSEVALNFACLLSVSAETLEIDTIEVDGLVVLPGNATDTQRAASDFRAGQVMQLANIATSGKVDKIRLNNCDVPLYAAAATYCIGFQFANGNWLINTVESNSLEFVETGIGTAPSIGIASNALNNIHTNGRLDAKNSFATFSSQVVGGAYIPNCKFKGMNIGSAAAAQPSLLQPLTSAKTYNVSVEDTNMAQTGAGYCGFPVYVNGVTAMVVNLNLTGVDMGHTQTGVSNGNFFIGGYAAAQGHTFNITSGGRNYNPLANGFDQQAGNTIYFVGNCSDLKMNVITTYVAKVDGASVYNTNAALGTLGHAGVVTCDYDSVTAGLLWKRVTGVTAGVPAVGTY